MSRETYYRVKRPETYPTGRVCTAKGCTTVLSRYNGEPICARCEEVERREMQEAQRLGRLLEAARA